MRTVIKTIITTVLLSTLLAMAGTVEARLKYYRYNDNIPMVEMSLNMMVAMGVLEPIPGRLVLDGNPYNRMVNASYGPYSRTGYNYPDSFHRYSSYGYNDYLDGPIDPYDSYYGEYNDRYYGGRYGYSPDYSRYRRWGGQWDSPWDYQSGNPWNSYWGNSYRGGGPWGNQWNSPWGNTWGSPWEYQSVNPWNSYSGGSPWGNQWNSPWGNTWGSTLGSPWGSAWSNPWVNPWSSQLGYPGVSPYTYNPGYSTKPLTPNTNLGDDWSKNSKNNSYQFDDSSRLNRNKENYKAEKTSWSANPYSKRDRRSSYRSGNKRSYRKLNGLWIGDNGAMLGIRGNRFLWYDNNNQYTKGQLAKSPTMMKARIEGSATVVRYHYRLHDNELVIMSSDGKMHTFNRMPSVELPAVSARPRATYSSYHPESADNARFAYTNLKSGPKVSKRSLNSPDYTDRAGADADRSRGIYSMAPRDDYSYKNASARTPRVPYASHRSKDSFQSVFRPVNLGSGLHARKHKHVGAVPQQQQQLISPLDSADADAAAMAPLLEQNHPATAGAESDNDTYSAVQPAEDNRVESSSWTDYAGLDTNDPNTYLYSYLRDNDNKRNPGSASAGPGKREGSSSSAVAIESDSSNIWKPNDLYPDRRSDAGNSQSNHSAKNTGWAQSEITADSGVKRFTWPDDGKPWN